MYEVQAEDGMGRLRVPQPESKRKGKRHQLTRKEHNRRRESVQSVSQGPKLEDSESEDVLILVFNSRSSGESASHFNPRLDPDHPPFVPGDP
jgi:hypothetical protein